MKEQHIPFRENARRNYLGTCKQEHDYPGFCFPSGGHIADNRAVFMGIK